MSTASYSIKKDIIKYFLWLFLVFVVFNLTSRIIIIGFIGVLSFKYIYSKDDVAYFVIFLSLISNLGGFFTGKIGDIISLGPIHINMVILFILINYFKYIRIPNKEKLFNFFSKPIYIYLLWKEKGKQSS